MDLKELDWQFVNLSVFNSAVYKKKMDLEYIEVTPKILMSISFDEYIDNLVICTESEMDEDDLFQEEFF